MKMRSIQRQLILTVLLLELLSAVAVTSIVYVHERHTVFRAFDVMLRGQADSLLGAVQDAEDVDDNVMLNFADVHAPGRDEYLVYDENGRMLGATAHAKELTVPPNMRSGSVLPITMHRRPYRAIVVHGSRWIDAAESSGGLIRHVTVIYASPVHRAWEVIEQAVLFYALASLMVMALTAAWMVWALRHSLAPLGGLALAATRLTAGMWKFDAPDEARRTRELQPLVAALEKSVAGMEDAFRRQQRFVGDAAHELKTAVAVVKSSLQLLTIRQRTEDEYRAGIDRCQQDLVRLEALVQQMLTLARAESVSRPENGGANKTEHDTSRCDIYPVAEAVADGLLPVAVMHGVSIRLHGDAAPARIEEAAAKTIVENLLSNAIQFSPRGGEIRVDVFQDETMCWVSISDQGPGIPEEDRESIFERFWRGDPSRSRQTGGSGLGLAIVKAILEQWGGVIRVESSELGGATLRIGIRKAAS